jgi:hypothetical protein
MITNNYISAVTATQTGDPPTYSITGTTVTEIKFSNPITGRFSVWICNHSDTQTLRVTVAQAGKLPVMTYPSFYLGPNSDRVVNITNSHSLYVLADHGAATPALTITAVEVN